MSIRAGTVQVRVRGWGRRRRPVDLVHRQSLRTREPEEPVVVTLAAGTVLVLSHPRDFHVSVPRPLFQVRRSSAVTADIEVRRGVEDILIAHVHITTGGF